MATEVLSAIVTTATWNSWTQAQRDVYGGSRQYSDLTTWLAAQQTLYPDLTVSNVTIVAECYNDWPNGLVDSISVSGFVTDATRRVKITSPVSERHTGKSRTGFYLNKTLNWSGIIQSLNGVYLSVEYIEIINNSISDAECLETSSNLTAVNLITSLQTKSGNGSCINIGGNSSIINCVISFAPKGILVNNYADATVLYNNTVVNTSVGVYAGWSAAGSIVDITNNVVMASGTTYSVGTVTQTGSNNASDTATTVVPFGTSPLLVNVLTTDFTDYANGDYSIAKTVYDVDGVTVLSKSQLLDAGTDLSAQFTTDIVGTVRG